MKLTTLAVAWLAGMALAHGWYDADPLPLLVLAGVAATAALACRLLGIAAWPALLVGACLLGLARYELWQDVPPPLLTEYEGSVRVRGRVIDDPEATATRIKFTLQLADLAPPGAGGRPNWQPHNARLLVYAHPPAALVSKRELPYFRYGDYVNLTGTLQQPKPLEKFDYPAYLESQGIYGIFWSQDATATTGAHTGTALVARFRAAVFDLRRALARGLDGSLPPTEAALGKALVLGLRGQLPEPVVEDFRQSGTSHLLAISGLHLGILLLMTVGLLHWALGRHTPIPAFAALAAVWLYVLISGAPVSVVRAAIMGSVYLAALGLGRPRDSLLPALALSVAAITAVDPGSASRISFQLSFAAMAGIALALPWQDSLSRSIAHRIERTGWRCSAVAGTTLVWLASGVLISAAATLATFPLVAFNFGRLPLLGIPATILATPLLPFVLAGGLIAALAGMIHPLLGQLAGLPVSLPMSALLALVEAVPKWTVNLDTAGSGWLWGWYALLLGTLTLAETRWYRMGVLGRLNQWFGIYGARSLPAGGGASGSYVALGGVGLALAGTLIYLLAGAWEGSDGRLHVHFLDVGQGDAIYIETPGGRQVLVDGGPEFGGAVRALSHRLPPWDRSLDVVASTHLDADHSRGLLSVLERYKTGIVVAGLPGTESHLYPQWRKALEQGDHHLVQLSAGQGLALDEGVTLAALHPPAAPLRGPAWNSNNNSLVMKLTYGEVSFLLTGDIGREAERYLTRTGASLQSDVLKVGHHGSNSSTTAAFLRAVNPRWAVISAGAANQYGHPHADVVRRLEEAVNKASVFSTATQGTIRFTTDGQRLWVDTGR